jgi:hypothetical protein
MAAKPALAADPAFVVASLGLSGLLTGMLIGRFLGLWLKSGCPRRNAAGLISR